MRQRALALLPATLVAVLALWSGTFYGAASAAGSLTTQVIVLACSLLAAQSLLDPLALGTSGRWLVAAGLSVVILSWWVSPVNRAGLLPIVLLPAYLLLPAATARCWSRPLQRRLGLISLSVLYLVLSGLALILWQVHDLPRASLPLGHHNLLAGWLLLLLPVIASNIRFEGPSRGLAVTATLTGVGALAASGSLLAIFALSLELLIAAYLWRPIRRWLLPTAVLIPLTMLPRLRDVTNLVDISALARMAYLEAGWEGILARPVLGWGPGATAWTITEFMVPVAGLHPATEIIGDLHSLPLQIGYETGVIGLLLFLSICAVFLFRRWREASDDHDPTVPRAALVGLSGGLLFGLGAAPLSVPALPATAAVVAGLTLSGVARPGPRWGWRPLLLYLLLATAVLAPAYAAQFLYESARFSQTTEEKLDLLDRARKLDPGFPLYAARWSWLAHAEDPRIDSAAGQALSAAKMARGSAPLWLVAGTLALQTDAPWAHEALTQAVRLDPLSPLPTFFLMQSRVEGPAAVELGAGSLAKDPRLASALWWDDHPDLARAVSQRSGIPIALGLPGQTGETRLLALTLDQTPAVAYTLFAFRRLPWPSRLAAVEIRHP